MNGLKKTALIILTVVLAVTLFGCGKKADEKTPIADVQAKADTMDVAALRQMAMTYKNAIEAKKKDLDKLADKIAKMGMDKAFSDSARSIQDDIAKVNRSISALKERFHIYYNKLKEKGGDLSGLSL